MIEPDAWVPLAEVARPHGVKGELRLRLYNTDSDVLLGLDEVLIRMKDGEEHEVSVDGARRADDAILMKLFSVDDRDRAEELRGALICVRRRDFPALEDGEFYQCDAFGAKVIVLPETLLGTVRGVRNYPSVDALIVRAADEGLDWEIPLVEAFIEKMDIANGVVMLKSIEGLERS